MHTHEFHDLIGPLVNFPKLALLNGLLKIPKQMSFQIQVRKNVHKNHKNEPLEFVFWLLTSRFLINSLIESIFDRFLGCPFNGQSFPDSKCV